VTEKPLIDIGFYQLAQRRAEAVLPPLVTKALAAGHRIVVRSGDAALLGRLDAALWNQAPDAFLPHGVDTDVGPARAPSQPVLLTSAPLPAANAADCLAQIGDDLPDDLTGLTRVLFLFDADNTETARTRWRKLAKMEGVRPVYWREGEGGRFEKAG
jgi:DNA polymerase-3 subunit chi